MDTERKVCPTCKREFFTDVDSCPDDGSSLALKSNDPLVGTVFAEKYEILSVIGTGGMSVIYKARHKYMERLCAVKLLQQFLVADDSMFQRFQYEAKAASTLSHVNVVAMHDFGITGDGRAYLVMDYLDGEDLSTVLERDVFLTEAQAKPIFRQVLAGLAHAHSKGVIHRDLKPSNIFLIPQSGSLLVKLVDFGIAKINNPDNVSQSLTRTGEVFGSPLYMSPEQCAGKSLDARSDIYSLGCLMYETLSGRRPLVGESALETMHMHLKEMQLTLSQAAPKAEISPVLENAVMKCLCKLAQDRFQSVAELYQEIFGQPLANMSNDFITAGIPVHSGGGVTINTGRSRQSDDSENDGKSGGSSINPGEASSAAVKGVAKDVVKGVVTPAAKLDAQDKSQKSKMPLVVALLSGLVASAGLYWIIAVWPGPESDRGTLLNRWIYAAWISRAEQLVTQAHYSEAEQAYNQVDKIAESFGDNSGREMTVLEAKFKLFELSNQPKKSEAILKAMDIINRNRALSDCDAALKEIDKIKKLYEKAREIGKDRGINSERELALQMGTKIAAIIGVSQRLRAANAYDDQENLLQKATDLYSQLVSNDDPQLADLKTALAYSHWDQDEIPQVRPLLAQALTITINANKRDARQASLIDVGESWLRLGQFDRDRSAYPYAEKELNTALSILRGYSKVDKSNPESVRAYKLLIECLNAFADYKTQVHQDAEARHFRDEVAVLKKVKLDYHPEPQ